MVAGSVNRLIAASPQHLTERCRRGSQADAEMPKPESYDKRAPIAVPSIVPRAFGAGARGVRRWSLNPVRRLQLGFFLFLWREYGRLRRSLLNWWRGRREVYLVDPPLLRRCRIDRFHPPALLSGGSQHGTNRIIRHDGCGYRWTAMQCRGQRCGDPLSFRIMRFGCDLTHRLGRRFGQLVRRRG